MVGEVRLGFKNFPKHKFVDLPLLMSMQQLSNHSLPSHLSMTFMSNIIIIAEVSTAHDMSDVYTDFLHIMDQHTTVLADTVTLDLTYFSNKFIECGFITQTAASDVLPKLGVSAGHKSQELLHLARHNYEISLKKQVWADKFIAIFSSQAASTLILLLD